MRATRIKNERLTRRIKRVRKKVSGTPERPRLAVTRSHRNISAQIIDDMTGRTLCAVSTQSKEMKASLPYGGNKNAAAAVGKVLAEKAKEAGITAVAFDRRGRKYHGRTKALADACREGGLKL